jgi:hypothetical protein
MTRKQQSQAEKEHELEKRHVNMGWILLTTSEAAAEAEKRKTLRPSFGVKRGAGITWKNRKAIAERRAQEASSGTIGVGHYKLNYKAVEKEVKAVPQFERETKARRREEERKRGNVNLAIREAMDVVAEESRGQYLKTNLPSNWAEETPSKPVFSYKEPIPLSKQAEDKKKLERMAEAARDTYARERQRKSGAPGAGSVTPGGIGAYVWHMCDLAGRRGGEGAHVRPRRQ